MKKKNSEPLINSQIKASKVRLIDENGKSCGLVSINQALDMANEASLDLVQIAGNIDPVVCKILNYGKYRYDKEKQKKINKKKQHVIHVKEIRFRPNVGDHDLVIKLKKAEKFLLNGDKLKITVMFRGREFSRQESGYELLERIKNILLDIANIDQEPNMQGKRLSLIMSPK
ncbi:MAG: translation initiation factor IF-3 [Candidatus Marinimicrobia bacterium]|nr:translation initiation factor IF-3 [Candidatus Neomarinimicrobiota bacterium]